MLRNDQLGTYTREIKFAVVRCLKRINLRPTQGEIQKKRDGPVLKNNVVGTYTRKNKVAVVQCSKRMNLKTSTRKNKKIAVVLCLKR